MAGTREALFVLAVSSVAMVVCGDDFLQQRKAIGEVQNRSFAPLVILRLGCSRRWPRCRIPRIQIASVESVGVMNEAMDNGGFVGEIRWRGAQDTCLDVVGPVAEDANKVQVRSCVGKESQQFWYGGEQSKGQIKWGSNPNKCIEFHDDGHLVLRDCHLDDSLERDRQSFQIDVYHGTSSGQIRRTSDPNTCLQAPSTFANSSSLADSTVVVGNCRSDEDIGITSQLWTAYDGGSNAKCTVALSEERCVTTSPCAWCNKHPAGCYNTVTDPLACTDS